MCGWGAKVGTQANPEWHLAGYPVVTGKWLRETGSSPYRGPLELQRWPEWDSHLAQLSRASPGFTIFPYA